MNKHLKNHLIASEKLEKIKNKIFEFIKNNIGKISEYDTQKFIIKELKKENLETHDSPIVAVNENASNAHYFSQKETAKIINENNLIMIDLWGSYKNSYYADITWMVYTGNDIPEKIKKAFRKVIESRDSAIKFIQSHLKNKQLPIGYEVDKITRDYLKSHGLDEFFTHTTGHSLGKQHCHGKTFKLSKKEHKKIKPKI